ncbi:MutY, C-terminal [Dillenia turbinata]|uniref:Adenine DNA glycosylase n=1 Tax=Dillenia turbinata TaxID=194707 RepID=A0AAN8V9X0_9MAGN
MATTGSNKRRRRRSLTLTIDSSRNSNDIEDLHLLKQSEKLEIRESILHWYHRNKRDLPWRRDQEEDHDDVDRRAYEVWVSEVMLQQTRVATVIDYYNRWILKWPTILHLSSASLEEVNEMWAGLGYYRRARFLLEGAKFIVKEANGFPKNVSALRKVPGIGDYTAGAVASIAFKEAVPAVDGNVVRVLARLRAVSANPREKLAGQLVDPSRPGDFNQGLMELGATICTPSNPSCSRCPLSSQCCALSNSRSHESISVTDYPVKVTKAKQRLDFSAVCVVEILEDQDTSRGSQQSRFLLIKRPDEGLLAGLWEFPSVRLDGETDLPIRKKAIDQYLKGLLKIDPKRTCKVVLREDIGEYIHIFTHIRLRMYIELMVLHVKGGIEVLYRKQNGDSMAWKLVDGEALPSMGLTSGVRKVYTMIQKFKQKSSSSSKARNTVNPKR